MSTHILARDGGERRCPQCRDLLYFSSHHPVLSVRTVFTGPVETSTGSIHYKRGWFCRNGNCDYRELDGEA
jgi:hypothetical protein